MSSALVSFLQNAFDKKTSFTKIHIPRGVLERNAEILGLQPPVKEFMVTAYMSTSRAVILIWFLINHIYLCIKYLFKFSNISDFKHNHKHGQVRYGNFSSRGY